MTYSIDLIRALVGEQTSRPYNSTYSTNFIKPTFMVVSRKIVLVRLFCARRLVHPGATAPPLPPSAPLSYAAECRRFCLLWLSGDEAGTATFSQHCRRYPRRTADAVQVSQPGRPVRRRGSGRRHGGGHLSRRPRRCHDDDVTAAAEARRLGRRSRRRGNLSITILVDYD